MTIFQPKLVMIDVDGTLVDSVPDLAYCVDQNDAQSGYASYRRRDSKALGWKRSP